MTVSVGYPDTQLSLIKSLNAFILNKTGMNVKLNRKWLDGNLL